MNFVLVALDCVMSGINFSDGSMIWGVVWLGLVPIHLVFTVFAGRKYWRSANEKA
jgi:hypothetical protein